jgi:ribosomal protein S18 acetylase RimI-like enzyme
MILRPAVSEDIPRIVAMERTPGARQFVGQWSEERHRAVLRGGDARYLLSESVVNETAPGTLEAYVILRGLSEDSGAIELKRIVVAVPERGLGRRILSEVIRMAFEDFHTHRLFLDVYEDNARARHLYESLGFVYEGTMRDAARRGETYCNLYLMSMLEEEYKKNREQRTRSRPGSDMKD